jgi:hypothetical protein
MGDTLSASIYYTKGFFIKKESDSPFLTLPSGEELISFWPIPDDLNNFSDIYKGYLFPQKLATEPLYF